METFSITESPTTSAVEITPVAKRKSPGVAFLLSLLYPGAGHFYCGKGTTGTWTAIFFTLFALVIVSVSPTAVALLWGIALRGAIVLYGFGFLDAFYTAREINAGVSDSMVGNNPRIAAMLNLLTAGFGYFYLGSRTKGIIWFLVSRAIYFGGGANSTVMQVVVEVVAIVVAADAFRIARKQQLEAFPPETTEVFATSEQQGLSPLVPIALGAILVLNYVLLVVVGVLLSAARHQAPATAQVSQLADGSTLWKNSAGLEAKLPSGWTINDKQENVALSASQRELGCQIGLMTNRELPVHGQAAIARGMERGARNRNPTYQWLSEGPASLAEKQAYALNFQSKHNNIPILHKIVFIQHGITLYSFFEASSIGMAGDCAPEMEEIQKSVKLGF